MCGCGLWSNTASESSGYKKNCSRGAGQVLVERSVDDFPFRLPFPIICAEGCYWKTVAVEEVDLWVLCPSVANGCRFADFVAPNFESVIVDDFSICPDELLVACGNRKAFDLSRIESPESLFAYVVQGDSDFVAINFRRTVSRALIR